MGSSLFLAVWPVCAGRDSELASERESCSFCWNTPISVVGDWAEDDGCRGDRLDVGVLGAQVVGGGLMSEVI